MTNREITVQDLGLSAGRCLVVGEVAQAHEGSLGMAHAYIDAIADAGAQAVKFQTHIARAESTRDEPWRVRFSSQDKSRYDYWRRMEFTAEQWGALAEHAQKRGLLFLSSPFSPAAVELLERLGVPLWKVASGEVSNPELLEAVWATGRPVLYSSGMSRFDELDLLTEETRRRGIPFALLQCFTSYPSPPESWGVAEIPRLRRRFNCPIGYSDHSGTLYAGLAAAALGAEIIEVHVVFHRKQFGPDVAASLTVDELRELVTGVEQIHTAVNTPYERDAHTDRCDSLRTVFGRSLAPVHDLSAGTLLKASDLTLKKPAGGMPYERRDELIGKRLRVDKPATDLFSPRDVE